MASHGVSRGTGEKPMTDQDWRKEQQRIKEYRTLIESTNAKIREHRYDLDTLELTSKLLRWNPEYYTMWNHRRRIMQYLFKQPPMDKDSKISAIRFVADDLTFLLPLLRKFPKCYWIWNYRLWLLEQTINLLPGKEARKFWEQELQLVSKMLSLDSRNFMGWGYRRTVVEALESEKLLPKDSSSTLTEEEFEYTTKMISTNLSNFSAWHRRSKLIPKLLGERHTDNEARRKFLDEELELIQRGLWTSTEDQSLWFYHQYLMCTFDPDFSAKSMAPQLTVNERSEYVSHEIDRVQEMIDGAEDCKWIYQSLVNLSLLYNRLTGEWPLQASLLQTWIDELFKLDALRVGKWHDLRSRIGGRCPGQD